MGGVMTPLTKRSTVYFHEKIHRALKLKALESSKSISELIHEAVCGELAIDQEDIQSFNERKDEGSISYEKMLNELKNDGKI